MSLAYKTLAIVIVTVACLIAGLYFAARFLLLRSFREAERVETQQAVDRAHSALHDSLAELTATTNDYAAWDRTYGFMRRRNPDYIGEEFKNDTLQGLSINSVLFLDTSGAEVFSKRYDFINKREVGYPAETRRILMADPWVQAVQSADAPRFGTLTLPEGPALIAACPILTSDRRGPVRGVLVMTRNLDAHFIQQLRSLTLSSVLIGGISARGPASLPWPGQSLVRLQPGAVAVAPWNDDVVAGYSLLRDVHGEPSLILQVDLPRDVFQRGVASLHYLLGALCLGSLVFGVVTLLLLHHSVLRRLLWLSEQVARIGQRKSLSDRVSVAGRDEIGQLSAAINSMLHELQQNDIQFRHIVENIHQIFWVRDAGCERFSYISPALEKVWGLSADGFEKDPSSWPESVHPDDRAGVDDMLEEQEDGLRGEVEFRLIRADRQIRWVRNRFFPLIDDAGQLRQIVGLCEDITELKRAEEIRLRSREELEGLVHERTSELAERARLATLGAIIGAILTQASELSGSLQECAAAFVEYLDAAEAQFWTLKPACMTPELEAQAAQRDLLESGGSNPAGSDLVERIAESNQPIFSNQLQDLLNPRDRQWAARNSLVSFAGHPLQVEGQMVGVVSMFAHQTLTEATVESVRSIAAQVAQFIRRVRTREALHASEEHFRRMFATIPLPIWLYDAATLQFLDVNQAALEKYGYAREEFLSLTVDDLLMPEPQESVAAGQASLGQTRHRARDGRPIDVDIHSQNVDFTGKSAVLVAARDITERNRLEMELRHGQKLQAVGSLAAGIAHEINTPIQFVADNVLFFNESFSELEPVFEKYTRLLAAAAAGLVPPELAEEVAAAEQKAELAYLRMEIPAAMKQTLDGIDRVTSIVEALKTFSHVDSSHKMAAADLNHSLESTIIVARNELRYVADVETHFGELPPVVCCIGDLNQVFLNLLVNAAHAIAEVVKNSGKRGRIRVQTRQENDCAVVSISDTGAGIPEAIRGRIFEPFFTTKGVGKGTGQGLALARSIVVEKHGGSLTFESEPGKGTTFHVRIPMAVAPALVEAVST